MKAKANLLRTLVVAAVIVVAVSVALFGVGLRTAETQTTIPKMQVQDLGTLGGSRSFAMGINDFGKVVGFSYTSDRGNHAFLYDESATPPKMQDLETLGGSNSHARGINNSGKVVGYSYTASGEKHAFLYDSTNGMKDLNTLVPADYGRTIWDATAINSKGQIAAIGESFADYYGSSVLTPATTATSAPYEVQALPTVESDYSILDATDINDPGQVVGTAWYALCYGCGDRHAFIYDESATPKVQDLGDPAGYGSIANGINDYGQVVGYARHAFIYDSTNGMKDLGTLGGTYSAAKAINNSGKVVGTSDTSADDQHAFFYESTNGMKDLNTLIPADSGWTINDASAINSKGQIAATGYKAGVGTHALLLTPTSDIPPPSDTTAPDTSITSGPNGPTNNTAPTFTFSGSDNVTTTANLKYQYRLDSGGWSAPSTSTTATPTGLSEGGHFFEVRAVDEAGNVDGSPAQRSFTVDTTKPMVKSTTPTPSGATDVGRGTNLTATFSEKMRTSSVNTTTFKLFKVNSDGTQTQITDVVVGLSFDKLKATLNPFGTTTTLLARNTKYKGVISTGTKDLAGNSLAQQKSWTFTTKP